MLLSFATLGHRTLAMTGRYVERAADMVRATADAVSNRVAAALNASAAALPDHTAYQAGNSCLASEVVAEVVGNRLANCLPPTFPERA